MYRNVVVLLDGSELAEGVLPHVAGVIRRRTSRVHLLSIIPGGRSLVAAAGETPFSPVITREEKQQVEEALTAYLHTVAERIAPAAAAVHIGVRFGRPAEEILSFVEEVGADLVAMSTHGRSGARRWVFGSVADRVLRGATCPVLLVQTEQSTSPAPYRRILLPLDGSELAEQVIPYVKALLQPDSTLEGEWQEVTHISLISVLTSGLTDRTVALLTTYPAGLQFATAGWPQEEAQAQAYLRSVAAALREQSVRVHIAIRQGAPADEILTYAEETKSDLIGMTTHGFSGVTRWVYGSVADKVLHGAQCPVLLVRPTPRP
jgi:nucleotide-binding universal stress UspA family protein